MSVLALGRPGASGPSGRARRRRPPKRPATVLVRCALVLAVVVFLFPIYLLVSISLKTPSENALHPFAPPLSPHFHNYADALKASSGTGTAAFTAALMNSVMITTGSVLLLVVIGSTAGYYLGRRTSRLSTGLYLVFVGSIVIPLQLVIIPVYRALDSVGLTGTRIGAIALYVGLLTPFSVFLFTSFVRALPLDFEEAALLDGCTHFQSFVRIVLPLLRPIVSTVAVLDAIAVWNDFFGQLVLLSGSGKETLPITVFSFAGQYTARYDLLSAGLVITVIPIVVLYLLLQRRVIEGFSSGVRG